MCACKAGALHQTELFARGAKLPMSNLLGQSTFATTPRKEPDTVGSYCRFASLDVG